MFIISQKEFTRIKSIDYGCLLILEYENVKGNLIKHRYLSSSKDYSNKINKKLKKHFKNAIKFSDKDINEFILSLKKGVYLDE